MQPAKINYKIYQGSTFQEIYRWESETKVYVPIQAVQKSAPCVITTTINHNLPQGWRIRVVGAGGIKELNSAGETYHLATEVTDNTITLNQVNSLQYTTYTSGGVVEYNRPVPLTSYSARMQIRETVDSDTVLYSTTSGLGGHLSIDLDLSTVNIEIPASVTQAFEFSTAVYSLELYESGGLVIPFLAGNLTLVPEVTRDD
jgi:hypothetical protein